MTLSRKTYIRQCTILILGFLLSLPLHAQEASTWEDFCEEYFNVDEENTASMEDVMEVLEGYMVHPLNLNTASREDLLGLPFINDAQADSIIAFRENKHGFLSMGDLMFIQNLSFNDRKYLHLFTRVGEKESNVGQLRKRLFGGKHTIETRLDIPLYTRAGQTDIPNDILEKYPNRKYLGNGIKNIVRYRYSYSRNVMYGITLEKDAGEPFGNRKNYPYDYMSAYFLYELPNQKARFLVGDYRIASGQGLIVGNGFITSPMFLLDAAIKHKEFFRPHTGTEENKFFRGAAANLYLKNLHVSLFASYNKVDASMKDGTVKTLLSTGLHRTSGELNSKNAVGTFVVGGRMSYVKSRWEIGITGLYSLYNKTIDPDRLGYNDYFFRGRSMFGIGADWRLNFRRWTITGEVAADKNLHPALSQTIVFQPIDELSLTLQHRHFSKKFVSLHGSTLQQANRVANEHGIMLGGKYSGIKNLELRAYLDAYIFPGETFLAQSNAKGIEAMAQGSLRLSRGLTLTLRYKMRNRQQNVTGYKGIMEYRQTHRVQCTTTLVREKFQIAGSLYATASTRQTDKTKLGWATAMRATLKPSMRFSASASASLFFTDDYSSAVYIYEPRLRYMFTNTSLFDRGFRIMAQATMHICKWMEISARYGCLHYFNREYIGTGAQLIASPTQQDLSVQAILKF